MAAEARYTRETYTRLQGELETLKTQRGEIREDIREAREQGDLRENFAYHAARDQQGMIEARIKSLEARLAGAKILEAGESSDEVVLGVAVTVRPAEAKGDECNRVYTIVTEEELDAVEDAASEASPIGQALLGKKVGDTVEVQGPRGAVHFQIVSIG